MSTLEPCLEQVDGIEVGMQLDTLVADRYHLPEVVFGDELLELIEQVPVILIADEVFKQCAEDSAMPSAHLFVGVRPDQQISRLKHVVSLVYHLRSDEPDGPFDGDQKMLIVSLNPILDHLQQPVVLVDGQQVWALSKLHDLKLIQQPHHRLLQLAGLSPGLELLPLSVAVHQ